MFQLPEFPSFDFSSLDLDAVRNSPIGKRISAIELPKFDLPKFDLPKIDLPKIDADKVTAVIRDAAYLTVGLGVAAVQQVRGLIRTAA